MNVLVPIQTTLVLIFDEKRDSRVNKTQESLLFLELIYNLPQQSFLS